MFNFDYMTPEDRQRLQAYIARTGKLPPALQGQVPDAGNPMQNAMAGQVYDADNPMQNPMVGQVFDEGSPLVGQVLDPDNPMQQQTPAPKSALPTAMSSRGNNRFRPAPPTAGQTTGGRMTPVEPPSPYDNPDLAIDVAGREKELERKRALGRALMQSQRGAEGRTVGPSNIYVGPSWGDVLGGAAERVGGGLMNRGLREEAAGIEADRQKKAEAELGLKKALDTRETDRYLYNREYQEARDALADNRYESEQERAEAIRIEDQNIRAAEREEDAANRREELKLKSKLSREEEQELARLEAELKEYDFLTEGLSGEQIAAIDKLPGQTERKSARVYANSIDTIDELIPKAEVMLENGQKWSSPGASMLGEAASTIGGKIGIPESARGAAENYIYDDDEREMRQNILSAYTEFRRSMAGANLTEMEKIIEAAGDPTQEGITSEESLRRVKVIRDQMARRLNKMGVPLTAQQKEAKEKREENLPDSKPPNLSQEEWEELQKLEAKYG